MRPTIASAGLRAAAGLSGRYRGLIFHRRPHGVPPSKMLAVRKRLKDLGLELYDCLSPGHMDYLSSEAIKKSGAYREK